MIVAVIASRYLLMASVVAIGAPGNDANGGKSAGHVRLYAWSDGDWLQRGSDIDGEAAGDGSGFSVSLSS